MTRDQPFDGEIASAEEFRAMLTELFRAAYRNDVEIEGAWACRNGGEMPDWEAVIVELMASDVE